MQPKFSHSTQASKQSRFQRLQLMLKDQKNQIYAFFNSNMESLLKNKKYTNYEELVSERLRMSEKFVHSLTETFFCMILDRDFLLLTTQIDINEKVSKFKKNISASWQKLIISIDSEIETIQKNKMMKSQQILSNDDKNQIANHYERDDNQDYYEDELDEDISSRRKGRGKNFKTPHQATLGMMQWLLRNFENPYPTTEEKHKMAKQGGISLSKVNNWFINARQRTVKSYFSKCS